jgi:hypothetical protein
MCCCRRPQGCLLHSTTIPLSTYCGLTYLAENWQLYVGPVAATATQQPPLYNPQYSLQLQSIATANMVNSCQVPLHLCPRRSVLAFHSCFFLSLLLPAAHALSPRPNVELSGIRRGGSTGTRTCGFTSRSRGPSLRCGTRGFWKMTSSLSTCP